MYYDPAGALRDMVQNHIMQMLAMIAMEPPVSLDAEAIRDAKLNVLRTLRPIKPAKRARTRCGRVTAAGVDTDGKPVPGYMDDRVSPTIRAPRLSSR